VNSRSHKLDSNLIVYDADRVQQPGPELFDPAYWIEQGAVAGEAIGRGSALFLETPFGDAVLRQYLRGGFPGRFNRDRYLFTGWERSRPQAEYRILEALSNAGLPVPVPIAAITARSGLFYRGSLLTRRIPDSLPLADLMLSRSGNEQFWQGVGACIRRFHEHGTVHADLNARNILVGPNDGFYLIDFDRARIAPGSQPAFARNLQRLRRSFEKLWPKTVADRLEPCWGALQTGYVGGKGLS
jgi:3-deoxy-D-manno-octulosonic acid kinase